MKLRLPLFFALLLCAVGPIYSQDKPELFNRLEAVLKEKSPKWEIERIYPPTASDPTGESITLKSLEGQASIQITIWDRLEDAVNTFDAQTVAFDRGMGKRMTKNTLAGFGDINHFWTNQGSDAWPTLKFRKEKILVSVFGPSIASVKQFAKEILVLLDAPEKK